MDDRTITVPVPPASRHTLTTRAAWDAARAACAADPGAYHGTIARRTLHWFVREVGQHGAWITQGDDGRWHGIDAATAEAVALDRPTDDDPWTVAFDATDAPFYRWFSGGLTNAGFNEVDRHVAMGHGDEVACLFEGDRWDPSLHEGRGGPVVAYPITRKQLLLDVALAAITLERLGVRPGDRIALNLPNIPEQLYYTEAAKRLGVLYTPVFGGFSDKTLSDRLHDAGARVVVTADGASRNAQIVPFKEPFTDAALDRFVGVSDALVVLSRALEQSEIAAELSTRLSHAVRTALAGDITVERSDVMRALGRALEHERTLESAQTAAIRMTVARALVNTPARADTVIVVRHVAQPELAWHAERDRWHHELAAESLAELLTVVRASGVSVHTREELLALPDVAFVRAIWQRSRPRPVDAEYPLFLIYTSGSTGKPKGVVHVHGGYTAGVAHTMRIAFDAAPGDVMYVVADPGWITGQSYMYSAALTTRVTSVLAEGAPVFPSAGRFASIIERYGVRIFKAGATFLKGIMQDPQHAADVRQHAVSSLRVATFCAEPTSPSVQRFAMELLCPWYINSYWATEHGGIVWTHLFGNADFPLRADAHTYPLPWVFGDVWVPELPAGDAGAGGVPWRRADDGEKGEIVITQPYPYLARTIWGDAAGFQLDASGAQIVPTWRGDIARFAATYWSRWRDTLAYTQGDVAVRYADGGFSLHGRSDDVINVSGHRLGTEEIEGAILRDKAITPTSPVGNVIVVGAPHAEKGLTPLAFVVPTPGKRLTAEDRRRLADLVRSEKGSLAVPDDFLEVAQFPETRSGKYMRRMVRALVEGSALGDTTTLRNPEAIDDLRQIVGAWQARQAIAEAQRVLDYYRYFRVQYHAVQPADRARGLIALVTVVNPPVNALNERALDELAIVVEHLTRRDDIAGIIFTGDGPSSFVAGADIRQLLDEVHTLEAALPLPNTAHLAFRRIETSRTPCIAAINGVALGGGLEFALACHYRIAEPTAVFGQPEIRLNLLPGYGGTQRLPRLLHAARGKDGLERACELILGGRSCTAHEALSLGLVDEVIDGTTDVVSRAATLLREGGATARQLGERQAARERWFAPRPDDAELKLVLDGDVVRALHAQAAHVGRTRAFERARTAIQTGWREGLVAGLAHEARAFAEAVIDDGAGGGKAGIRAFFDKRSAPLPVRSGSWRGTPDTNVLLATGALLPVGAAFYPGLTPLPSWQFAHAVTRDTVTGAAQHGVPRDAEREVVIPVREPGPNEALVYVLASEVNFNDIWAITGIPVSPFDNHDLDEQVTGSGGVGLVAAMGSALKAEGRVRTGDLVAIYSGQSDLLSPFAARDPMSADFAIQGYETDTGSHQQFLVVQGPQLHAIPSDLTLEQAGGYILNLGTVVRALFTTLALARAGDEPSRRIGTMFVEGAATGTGFDALRTAARQGIAVTGLVSSDARAASVRAAGARGTINRRDPVLASCFVPVPHGDAAAIAAWERAGDPLLAQFRAQHDGRLADAVVSHAGETSFPRGVQLLADGGTIAFYGASSGYHFTFAGKAGAVPITRMLARAGLRAGESVLVFYGDADNIEDVDGLAAIEATRALGARIAVATRTDAQREFVASLGYGDAVKGVLSLTDLARRFGDDFEWPATMPPLPDVRRDSAAFRDAVRRFQERTIKPFGSAVGRVLRAADNPRGAPALVVERAWQDTLAVSTSIVQPFTGRVVYAESMAQRRYAFYAPQVWTRQRRIYCPTFQIFGTHLCNAYEVVRMNEMLDAGLLEVTPPTVVDWADLPEAHQAMWENRHTGSTYVVNHALPAMGLRTRDALYEAWAARDAERAS
ncbi:MAG: AMP-binding protein [Gemmatimonadaceae bacterium]|jgi:acrylyl-CoA reductase (NADPH)/3-hydroxypropionyl-CoA dehydratase/3-hydroxypropionyl-CoA synthetase|nr:AMP-binding protein [Gemmatimonadaceae bacterium]